ncbi:MAG: hypothetical protein ACRD35_08450, partial [Candidatus Acidiferrales bacterium]
MPNPPPSIPRRLRILRCFAFTFVGPAPPIPRRLRFLRCFAFPFRLSILRCFAFTFVGLAPPIPRRLSILRRFAFTFVGVVTLLCTLSAQSPSPRPPLFADSTERRFSLNKTASVATIPLGPGTGIDLTACAALSFLMKGETGGETVRFEVEGDTPSKFVNLGSVYTYLPSGLTTDWQQVVIEISPDVSSRLPRASTLRVRLYENREAAVRLKELSVLPRLPDSDGWNRLVIRLADYGQSTLDGVALVALDYYEGQGTRLAKLDPKEIRDATPPEQEHVAREAPRRTPVFALGTAGPGSAGALQPVQVATFEQAPSTVRLRTPKGIQGREARAVRLDYKKRAQGFCGFRMQLAEMDNRGRTSTYFDATPYRFLSFWVRGSKGRADLTVKLADERWAEKQDSLAVATVSDILQRDIGKKWQEVLIPLEAAKFRQLDFTRLTTLAFNFSRRGSGTVY